MYVNGLVWSLYSSTRVLYLSAQYPVPAKKFKFQIPPEVRVPAKRHVILSFVLTHVTRPHRRQGHNGISITTSVKGGSLLSPSFFLVWSIRRLDEPTMLLDRQVTGRSHRH